MNFELDQLQIKIDQGALFHPLSVTLREGEIGTIMGPSGSGKSTLLAAISGTLLPQFKLSGDIRLGGQSLLDLPVQQRRVGILFQEDLLFPHLDVCQNLLFAVPSGASQAERLKRVIHALAGADMAGFERRDIATLSGGQRARISLLRTLLGEPALILLDEPFAKLDIALRNQFRQWVFQRITDMRIPALLVTHDPNDQPEQGPLIELESPSESTHA